MEAIGKIMFFVILIAGMALLLALPTLLLWNWLMPTIFGLVKITFWQALGINMLTGILFKPSSVSTTKDKK